MNFTQTLAQQQTVIDAARAHYRECQDKLNHLYEQVQATDPWDLSDFARLNQEIGAAARDSDIAWADWSIAIDAIADIPTSEDNTATMAEWEEAAALLPKGFRVVGAWFYDSHGSRTNLPDGRLSERQVGILTGAVAVK